MLNRLPSEQRLEASALIREACEKLGVPEQRGRQVLYWHAHTTKRPIESIDTLKAFLAEFEDLIRRFNREIALQQLRRQRTAEIHQPA